MPSIKDSLEVITSFPNLFVSPFGNDNMIALYSSIPLTQTASGNCLPCRACGNSNDRAVILASQSNVLASSLKNETSITVGQ